MQETNYIKQLQIYNTYQANKHVTLLHIKQNIKIYRNRSFFPKNKYIFTQQKINYFVERAEVI